MTFARSVAIVGLLFVMALSLFAQASPPANETGPPTSMILIGASADPNGGVASAALDVGFAKQIAKGTYLGVMGHLTPKSTTPFQISTKVQLHAAEYLAPFRSARIYWTAEVGPDFLTQIAGAAPVPTTQTNTQIGYTVGSGPLISIPIGKQKRDAIMPHAEMVKGSMEDLGWRGGVLFSFGGS